MMFTIWQTPIRIISRSKLSGIGDHWGVQLPNGDVVHLTPTGEKIVSFIDFAQGRPVKEIRRAPPEQYAQIMQRVTLSVQNPGQYRLLDRNCETYATWLIGEKPQSPQVQGVVVLGLIAAFLRFA
ncbi:MAG: NC domain protein [Burkholderiales bacterium RIFOXYD12_FULL_59_19]|nr:MAG: NC domain protein [Burkholderiales bacterium RIFOXYD12_FULL_59_19]